MQVNAKGKTYGFHDSLIIPVGAKSAADIENYVGNIDAIFGKNTAFLVSFSPLAPPSDLPVWQHERSFWLNYPSRLWVDVDYRNYRKTC